MDREALVAFLAGNGYVARRHGARAGRFRACAAASSICGRPASEEPLRLDFFGATLDAIRRFDAETQLSNDSVARIALLPASEAPLDAESHQPLPRRLCRGLRRRRATIRCMKASAPGARRKAWSIGCRCSMTIWTRCSIICRAALVLLGHQAEEAKAARLELIADCYDTREQFRHQEPDDKNAIKAPPYKPLKPETLYLTDAEWKAALAQTSGARSVALPGAGIARTASMRAAARAAISRRNAPAGNLNVFQAAADHLKALQAAGKRVLVASWTEGSAERMGGVLSDHGVTAIRKVDDWPEALKLDASRRRHRLSGHRARLRGAGFRHLISEQDMLGDRMVRAQSRAAPGAEFPRRSLVAGAGRSGHPYRAWRRPLSGPEGHRCAGRAA